MTTTTASTAFSVSDAVSDSPGSVESLTLGSSILQTSPVPRLERVDGKTIQRSELKSRRFSISIQSIYYFLQSDKCCAAVLLRTSFELHNDDKLKFALVPLSARTPGIFPPEGSSENENEIEISDHFPTRSEWVQIAEFSQTQDLHRTPILRVDVLGTGGEIGGVGVDTQRREKKVQLISLQPFHKRLTGHPTYLDWKFEDPQCQFYPPAVDLLIVVSKSSQTATTHEIWFPFELRLEWQLKVDVAGKLGFATRLVNRLSKHDGWRFQIKGQYRPEGAQKALAIARNTAEDVEISVGLRAAVKPWLAAQHK